MNRRVAVLFCVVCAVCALMSQAQNAPESLPPGVHAAFEQGQAAAAQKKWDLAIKYFSEVQQTANAIPNVLFNLGRAHGEAGHDLTGIAWLQVYLAADPQASNTETVRKEITRLDTANQARMADILQQALDRAMKTEDKIKRKFLLGYICTTMAKSGDMEGALKLLPSYQALGGEMDKGDLWKTNLESQAAAGQVQASLDGLPRLQAVATDKSRELDNRVAVLLAVYHYQIDAADWEGAQTTVKTMPEAGVNAETRNRFFQQISDAQEKSKHDQNTKPGTNPAVAAWLSRAADYASSKSVCGDDLDVQTAIHNATLASIEVDQAAENLADLANNFSNCSNAVRALNAKLTLQAHQSTAK
jgi:hypothetical protein